MDGVSLRGGLSSRLVSSVNVSLEISCSSEGVKDSVFLRLGPVCSASAVIDFVRDNLRLKRPSIVAGPMGLRLGMPRPDSFACSSSWRN